MIMKMKEKWDYKNPIILLEKTGEYARVARVAIKKLKRARLQKSSSVVQED